MLLRLSCVQSLPKGSGPTASRPSHRCCQTSLSGAHWSAKARTLMGCGATWNTRCAQSKPVH